VRGIGIEPGLRLRDRGLKGRAGRIRLSAHAARALVGHEQSPRDCASSRTGRLLGAITNPSAATPTPLRRTAITRQFMSILKQPCFRLLTCVCDIDTLQTAGHTAATPKSAISKINQAGSNRRHIQCSQLNRANDGFTGTSPRNRGDRAIRMAANGPQQATGCGLAGA
jgi:hypothetical protein